jgi:hypothetical protein
MHGFRRIRNFATLSISRHCSEVPGTARRRSYRQAAKEGRMRNASNGERATDIGGLFGPWTPLDVIDV